MSIIYAYCLYIDVLSVLVYSLLCSSIEVNKEINHNLIPSRSLRSTRRTVRLVYFAGTFVFLLSSLFCATLFVISLSEIRNITCFLSKWWLLPRPHTRWRETLWLVMAKEAGNIEELLCRVSDKGDLSPLKPERGYITDQEKRNSDRWNRFVPSFNKIFYLPSGRQGKAREVVPVLANVYK